MIYRRRASPLHSARAAVGCVYCLALTVAALTFSNPVVLGALALAVAGAGLAAGIGPGMRRAMRFALPFAVMIAVVNALLDRDGLTVILRLGDLPLLGHTDVTLEATLYGAILGLRAMVLIMCAALYTLAVDPDEVLTMLRRLSFRSALTATLATRMVPVLLRDSRRLAEAQRCRPGPAASRLALMRATSAGMMDRALDVAAVLEVRGFALGGRSATARRPWSRHDRSFGLAAAAILILTATARAAHWAPFAAYPALRVSADAGVVITAAVLVVVTLAPFTDRRGVAR